MAKPGEIAVNEILDRQRSIRDELGLVGVKLSPSADFEVPRPDEPSRTIRLATRRDPKVPITLIDGVEGLYGGRVALQIVEDYSYESIGRKKGPSRLILQTYSYGISFLIAAEIDPARMAGEQPEHWGEMIVVQRRFYRFDGESEDPDARGSQTIEYKNQHPLHHLHMSMGKYLRYPVPRRPSVLAVACFALVSFAHDRWLAYAANTRVLAETRLLLPDATVD